MLLGETWGFPLESLQGNLALSRVEGELCPFDLWQETRGSSCVAMGETGLPFWCKGKVWIPLEFKQGNRPSFLDKVWNIGPFHVLLGTSGFLLSCEGYTGEPLGFHKGSQASFQVAGGNVGLLSSHCRGIGPHRVDGGISWFFSSCGGKVGVPLELRQGSQETLYCLREIKPPFMLQGGTLGFLLSR